jgi:hypothetical protein
MNSAKNSCAILAYIDSVLEKLKTKPGTDQRYYDALYLTSIKVDEDGEK